jgi:hypothetical protein
MSQDNKLHPHCCENLKYNIMEFVYEWCG